MQQVTFRIPDLRKIIGDKVTGNLLVTINEDKRPTATIIPAADSLKLAAEDEVVWIDGCPFPPGCTEEPQP